MANPQPVGWNAPPTERPWCKGLDTDAIWEAAGKAAARNGSDTATEAIRLAYLAGARDAAAESARDVATLAASLLEPRSEYAPDALSCITEMWRIMWDNAPAAGKHCLKMQRNFARDAKAAKAKKPAKPTTTSKKGGR